MTSQDFDDIVVLKHAVKDILREIDKTLKEVPFDVDCDAIVENGAYIKRIGEIMSAIRDNGKHLPFKEE